MRVRRSLISIVLVMSVSTVIAPLITMKSRAANSPLDISNRALADRANLAGNENAASVNPIMLNLFTDIPETDEKLSSTGKISPEMLDALRINQSGKPNKKSKARSRSRNHSQDGQPRPQSGQPQVLNERSALSAALITSIGGRDNQFSEVTLLADWDGREDCVADRELKVDDVSNSEAEIDETITRVALSEHTIANGFNEDIIYHGNSRGLFCVCDFVSCNLQPVFCICISIPILLITGESGGVSLLNPIQGDCTDDQVTITGIAVNPVADLGDFGLCGTIGEVVYVSVLDTEGCSSNAANQPFRTRIFALGFQDVPGGVAPVGAIQILRSPLANIAGLAVDDDGNLYFHLVDLINLQNGGAIFKVTETPRVVSGCGSSPRINRVIASIPNGLAGDMGLGTAIGSTANPVLTSNGFRLTNYSGPSFTFGNVVSLATGASNVLYAAVARSFNDADNPATQATEGAFPSPAALGPTPSMIISFADCSGGFDSCTSPAPGIPGALPVADGIADVAQGGLTRIAGVNNFRVFALGNGPDIRPQSGGTSAVPGTPASVLKVDMQIDFTIHSGITVNEEGTVFVISGGTPAGVGKNPSPMLGEILCFEDRCPADRRADFIDFRGDLPPDPQAIEDDFGDGDSDRFDHIFHQAPLDQVTLTPAGLAGLARGFLRYTNRLAPNPISPGVTLGVIGGQTVQGDDDTSGPIFFDGLDRCQQVSRGFELLFGAIGTPGSATTPCVNNAWSFFFLNSNGNITFGGGDTNPTPTVTGLRSGLPRIAPAWSDLNPNARAVNPINFPVQALGFSTVNAFRVRWLNVPESGREGCASDSQGIGGITMALTLILDGVEIVPPPVPPCDQGRLCDLPFTLCRFQSRMGGGLDLNNICATRRGFCLHRCRTGVDYLSAQSPALTFNVEPNTGQLIGCPRRLAGTGNFIFDYSRMDLLGTPERPVITGYSEDGALPTNPPGLCETNLSTAAAIADTSPFGVIDGQTASIESCLIGEGTEPHIFELFNEGLDAGLGTGGEVFFATPDFDLRAEGNDPALCTPARQNDLNRGRVGFFGKTCPPEPITLQVTPAGTVAVAMGQPAVGSPEAGTLRDSNGNKFALPTSGIINAICDVQLNVFGCGFFPNETTTVCAGFSAQTGLPLERAGKTVSTSAAITCDTNGDTIPDATIPLSNIIPLNRNLVRATLPALSGSGLPGTPFPLACCGGLADLVLTTTFTPGDNNQFGAFTKTTSLPIDLGARAPVVISATPSSGDCTVAQDLLVTGSCFLLPDGIPNVTSVFAIERGNPSNRVQASNFVVLSPNLIDAFFNFGAANDGKTFLIFASGPSGTSQNLTTLPAGATGCPAGFTGNQQGIQVTFNCSASNPPPTNAPAISGCKLERTAAGGFALTVTGNNIMPGATVTVGGVTPRKVKFRDRQNETNTFNRLVLKGRICNGLSGPIVVTNPGVNGGASKPYNCAEKCH